MFIINDKGEKEDTTVEQVMGYWIEEAEKFESTHDDFKVNFVLCSVRAIGKDRIGTNYKEFVGVMKKHKDDNKKSKKRNRIVGYDLIGEENIHTDPRLSQSIPLNSIKDAMDNAKELAEKEGIADMWRPVFHAGEASAMPENENFQQNMRFATDNNSKRYGHGIAIILD